jgi:hypothetical protein
VPATLDGVGSQERRSEEPSRAGAAEMKQRQVAKIREVRQALLSAGFVALDEQAEVLGVPRSTAWTILKAHHKNSGLSVATINRMLAAPRLPPTARAKILEYVDEKSAGLYGDTRTKLRRFTARLVAVRQERVQEFGSKWRSHLPTFPARQQDIRKKRPCD